MGMTPAFKKPAALYCAIFENGLSTVVKKGENGGRILPSDFVVRTFRKLAVLKPGDAYAQITEFDWPAAWVREKSGAAVFLQSEGTMEILDAESRFPLDPPTAGFGNAPQK